MMACVRVSEGIARVIPIRRARSSSSSSIAGVRVTCREVLVLLFHLRLLEI
jgi:hypothetical protein